MQQEQDQQTRKFEMDRTTKVFINIRKFDVATMKGPKVSLILGKRNVGKSFLVCDLLYHLNYSTGVVKCPANLYMEEFDFLPKGIKVVGTADTDEAIDALLEKQLQNPKNPAVLVVSDCYYTLDPEKSPKFQTLLRNRAAANINVIMTQQYPHCNTTNKKLDYLFVMRNPMIADRRKIYDTYIQYNAGLRNHVAGGCAITFDEFCEILDKCTDNYECLVVDFTKPTEPGGAFYWYKAESHYAPTYKFTLDAEELLQLQKPQCPKGSLGYVMDKYERDADFKAYVDAYDGPSSLKLNSIIRFGGRHCGMRMLASDILSNVINQSSNINDVDLSEVPDLVETMPDNTDA